LPAPQFLEPCSLLGTLLAPQIFGTLNPSRQCACPTNSCLQLCAFLSLPVVSSRLGPCWASYPPPLVELSALAPAACAPLQPTVILLSPPSQLMTQHRAFCKTLHSPQNQSPTTSCARFCKALCWTSTAHLFVCLLRTRCIARLWASTVICGSASSQCLSVTRTGLPHKSAQRSKRATLHLKTRQWWPVRGLAVCKINTR
jgi:hypothetical protein